MGLLWQKLILIAAILAVTIPLSSCHRRRRSDIVDRGDVDAEQSLRDLCSRTDRSDVCWNILKPELRRFANSDERDIVDGVIDLATQKSRVIGDQLDKWFRDSNDESLKEKYRTCAESYNGIERNLGDLRQNNYRRIADQVDDAQRELEDCKREYGSGTFDPGHIGDRNSEIGLYLQMVRAASDRLGNYWANEAHE